jgi:subtilisin family serine protease
MDGVADHVKIMILRAVPDGDERDKDVANSIRYATDNGAKIINMSFGKSYSPYKNVVDEAILYAQSKNVLIIHAAGNESANNDKEPNFPSAFINGKRADNWIEVGASDPRGNAASFSNYGINSVDLFAPGLQIYSTLPFNKYGSESGTSMASPVVAGVAALVWSHYPDLSMKQLKSILLSSATPENTMTIKPGSRKKSVPFSSLSITGGIINAEKAMKSAAKISQSH